MAKNNRIQATFKKPAYQKRWDTMMRNAKPWIIACDDFFDKKINNFLLN